MNKGKIISIVGAPRSGKSFLTKRLGEHFNAQIFLEGEESDLPERIMKDIKENIRPFERTLWFRNRLVEKQLKAEEIKKQGSIVIMDTFWGSVEPYISIVTEEFEREILTDILDMDKKLLKLPDLTIFLQNTIENTKRFLSMGGRDFDSRQEYITNHVMPAQENHIHIFSTDNFLGKLLALERSNLDFDKEEDFQKLVRQIDEVLSN